jgi:probable phosphoglycerate mutase
MSVTRILLVRHGDSVHKAEGVFGGPKGCRGLTGTGRVQAEALGARLGSTGTMTGPVSVYSSTIPRAVETAGVLADALGVPTVEQDCGLCSYHMPDWADGMRWDEIGRGTALPAAGGCPAWPILRAITLSPSVRSRSRCGWVGGWWGVGGGGR